MASALPCDPECPGGLPFCSYSSQMRPRPGLGGGRHRRPPVLLRPRGLAQGCAARRAPRCRHPLPCWGGGLLPGAMQGGWWYEVQGYKEKKGGRGGGGLSVSLKMPGRPKPHEAAAKPAKKGKGGGGMSLGDYEALLQQYKTRQQTDDMEEGV